MANKPALRVSRPRGPVRAVALVLHGGQERGLEAVRPWAPPVLRMLPFAWTLRRRARSGGSATGGLAVARLRYAVKGWNGALRSPVLDARWALEQLHQRFGDVPIGLVGHSMGGRTAFAVADDPAVVSVVGLAPWVENGDRADPVAGRRLLIMHGTADRITDPRKSARFAEQAQALGAQVTYVSVTDAKHAMLERPGLWHSAAAGFTIATLFDLPEMGTARPDATNVVTQALAGRFLLTV